MCPGTNLFWTETGFAVPFPRARALVPPWRRGSSWGPRRNSHFGVSGPPKKRVLGSRAPCRRCEKLANSGVPIHFPPRIPRHPSPLGTNGAIRRAISRFCQRNFAEERWHGWIFQILQEFLIYLYLYLVHHFHFQKNKSTGILIFQFFFKKRVIKKNFPKKVQINP